MYNPSPKDVAFVDVPDRNFLRIDGAGSPNAPDYMTAIQTRFPVAYAIKFLVQKDKAVEYDVLPLEGLYWVDDMTKFSMEQKDQWQWKAMIMQPKYIIEADFKVELEHLENKKLPAFDKMRYECFREGKAAQIIVIEPFSFEGGYIQKIHASIKSSDNE